MIVTCFEVCGQHLDQLNALVERALEHHPRVAQSVAEVRQAIARHDELMGFFDPSLRLAGGASDEVRSLPVQGDFGSPASKAYEIEGSLEVPFQPGFYLGVGLLERDLHDPEDYDSLYQSLVGAGLRIPLLRDRGFAVWELERMIRLAEVDRARHVCRGEIQRLRHDVERAYISVCERIVLRSIALEATGRFESLLGEAESLVEHNAIAEYQVLAPRTELELSKAEHLAARQALETSLLDLQQLLAMEEAPRVEIALDGWVGQIMKLSLGDEVGALTGLKRRGDYLAIADDKMAAELAIEAEREFLRGDLSVKVGATWQAEDRDTLFGTGESAAGERWGGHVMLVYRQVLGHRSEKSRIAELEQRTVGLDERLRAAELEITRDLNRSRTQFDYSRKRLAEATKAVASATKNLAAEQERFRLGVARSRHVLDAQKDVTAARRAQTLAAVGVFAAWSDYRFATGYEGKSKTRFSLGPELPTEINEE